MTLGEQLKGLRNERGMSQPELAAAAGIEQSYLSKLENDKSLPSNDIFRNLLQALEVSLGQFMRGFAAGDVPGACRQIPDVEQWLNRQQQTVAQRQRRYLYACSALIVVALTLFYTGAAGKLFGEQRYHYRSDGVVLAGEPKNVFDIWSRLIDPRAEDADERHQAKQLEMFRRSDRAFYLSYEHRGPSFEATVPGGRRFYRLIEDKQVPRPINAWLQIVGVLLLSAGVMGFVIERRLFK